MEDKTINDYTEELKEQIRQIDALLSITNKRLLSEKGTENEFIRTMRKGNVYQYYLVDDTGKRTYVKTKDLERIKKIIQKDYDEKVYKALATLRYRIERFTKQYDIRSIDEVYNQLPDARKVLVAPIIPTDEAYIQSWLSQNPGNMNSYPIQTPYITENCESVRSKSEKILADLFAKYNIPYIYEPMFKLKDAGALYPDFALLDLNTRKTVYWEHFGLITDGDYAVKAMKKLSLYEKNGLEIGKNLLFSMESEKAPLNVKEIEKKLRKICYK